MTSWSHGAIVTRTRTGHFAGTKAPADVRAICASRGMRAWDLAGDGDGLPRAFREIRSATALTTRLLRQRSEDVCIAQYPLGRLPDRLLPGRGDARKIAVIHDVEELRGRRPSGWDCARLAGYDALIAHGELMAEWLRDHVPGCPVVTLEMFDYLTNAPKTPRTGTRPSVLYVAANLRRSKVGYLYRLGPTATPVVCYGPECDVAALPTNVRFGGLLDLDEPAFPAVDGLGLVWDGDTSDHLSGHAGDYLRYNAPHKLSFYIAAGLPVVVPREAAVADYVLARGVGLVADSVQSAAEQVRALGAAEWQDLVRATRDLQAEVRSGAHTTAAVTAAMTALAGVR